MRFGHVAAATGTDGECPAGSAADAVHDPIMGDETRHHVPADVGCTRPKLFAGCRVEAENLAHDRDDQLGVSARQLHEDRRVPRFADAAGSPLFLARDFVQRDERLALDSRVYDDQVFVQNWRRGRAPAVDAVPDVGVPQLPPLVIERQDAGFAKKRIDSLAVGHGRVGCVAVALANLRLLRHRRRHFRIPEDLARAAIETDQVPFELLDLARRLAGHAEAAVARYENSLAQNDRARRARTRQANLPRDVAFIVPTARNTLLGTRSLSGRSAKLQPIAGDQRSGKRHRAERQSQQRRSDKCTRQSLCQRIHGHESPVAYPSRRTSHR